MDMKVRRVRKLSAHPHPGWDVIVGRQEVVLGTGRLLDDNEGVNVRSAFDGVRFAGKVTICALLEHFAPFSHAENKGARLVNDPSTGWSQEPTFGGENA